MEENAEWVLDRRWNIGECPGLFRDEFIEFVRSLSYINGKDPNRARIILSVTATEHLFKVVERPEKGLFSFNSTHKTSKLIHDILPVQNMSIFFENPFVEDVYHGELFVNVTWRTLPEIQSPCEHIIINRNQFDHVLTDGFLNIIKLFMYERGRGDYDTIRISCGTNAHMGIDCIFELMDCGSFYEVIDIKYNNYHEYPPNECIKIHGIFKDTNPLKEFRSYGGIYVHCELTRNNNEFL